jgi:receptor expression-enhancing protein 5/6
MLACLVGTVYPCLKSIHALKTTSDSEDDKIWLTYWCVYGFSSFADLNIGWILNNFPGYYVFKLLFFLWL